MQGKVHINNYFDIFAAFCVLISKKNVINTEEAYW
jgi:hypothetical protein